MSNSAIENRTYPHRTMPRSLGEWRDAIRNRTERKKIVRNVLTFASLMLAMTACMTGQDVDAYPLPNPGPVNNPPTLPSPVEASPPNPEEEPKPWRSTILTGTSSLELEVARLLGLETDPDAIALISEGKSLDEVNLLGAYPQNGLSAIHLGLRDTSDPNVDVKFTAIYADRYAIDFASLIYSLTQTMNGDRLLVGSPENIQGMIEDSDGKNPQVSNEIIYLHGERMTSSGKNYQILDVKILRLGSDGKSFELAGEFRLVRDEATNEYFLMDYNADPSDPNNTMAPITPSILAVGDDYDFGGIIQEWEHWK